MKGMTHKQIKQTILSGGEVKGNCRFCNKEVDGKYYCFGCHHFICEECESADPPIGYFHKVEEHRRHDE